MLLQLLVLVFALLAAVALFAIWTSMTLGFLITGVPFVGSKRRKVLEMLRAVNLKEGQVFYDLGSGDGRVVFAALGLANVRAIGFELARWPYFLSNLKKFAFLYKCRKMQTLAGGAPPDIRFIRENFLECPWTEADVIYCYLSPKVMRMVEKKFLVECRPGTMVISNAFEMPNYKHESKLELTNGTAYIYRKN